MAEIAGLALGGVPIVVSLIQQYSTLLSIYERFKHYETGIEDLHRLLKAQKTMFVNETRLLLASAVGKYNAFLMMEDINHTLWEDVGTRLRIEGLIGDSKEALFGAAGEVLRQMERLADAIDHEKTIGNRLKFGLAKAKFRAIRASIREAREDYRTIRKQISELACNKPVVERADDKGRDSLCARTTQAAAKRVYETLTAACKQHTKHHAYLSLKPVYSCTGSDVEIKFQMAYRHLSAHQATTAGDVLWFIVESTTGSMAPGASMLMTQPGRTPSEENSVKRPISPFMVNFKERVTKGTKQVRFRSPSPTPVAQTHSTSRVRASASKGLPNLCLTADLCRQLINCYQRSQHEGVCIGWLEDSLSWKHKVYQSRSPCPENQQHQVNARSLTEVLLSSNVTSDVFKPLSPMQRLQVAKLLSTAMLNYDSTPWMQNSWRSDDIFLYNTDRSLTYTTAHVEPDAFVDVPVSSNTAHDLTRQASFDIPHVRNSTLFSLGVLLLELAFEKPLAVMVKPCDDKPGRTQAERDWYAALRLSRALGTGFGAKYSKMVEQCLFCDFGYGAELDNPALQDAVYRDIVTESDTLIQGFSQLLRLE